MSKYFGNVTKIQEKGWNVEVGTERNIFYPVTSCCLEGIATLHHSTVLQQGQNLELLGKR